jgi:hypothetical protein
MTRQNTEDDFWRFVEKTDGCWQWIGHRSGRRYGGFKLGGKEHRAHRLSWELHNGPVPTGLVVRHDCDNPLCVRPDHLRIGTQAQNIADMDNRGRRGIATGDRNGMRTHPEKRQTGERHWSVRNPELTVKGERNSKAKLTADQVLAIRAAYQYNSRSHGSTAIGREYGISSTSVLDIIKRHHWCHI